MNYSITFTEISFSAETSFCGRDFGKLTDHKPLLGLFSEDKISSNMAPPRLIRWALELAAYKYKIRYNVIQIEALYTYFYQVLGRALYIRSEGQLDRI